LALNVHIIASFSSLDLKYLTNVASMTPCGRLFQWKTTRWPKKLFWNSTSSLDSWTLDHEWKRFML